MDRLPSTHRHTHIHTHTHTHTHMYELYFKDKNFMSASKAIKFTTYIANWLIKQYSRNCHAWSVGSHLIISKHIFKPCSSRSQSSLLHRTVVYCVQIHVLLTTVSFHKVVKYFVIKVASNVSACLYGQLHRLCAKLHLVCIVHSFCYTM